MNDAPSFNVTANNIIVAEDSPAYSAAWATDMSAGPGEEQNVTFSTQCDDAADALFSAAPSVDAAGVLRFTLAANAFGSSRCSVTLTEAGEGGLSATAGLSITVTPVNDPPSFAAGPAVLSVLGDSGAYSAAWASNISAGPGEAGQALALSIACSGTAGGLFAAGPAISPDGVLSFTPAATKSGAANCTVTLAEAGQGGLKATAPLSIVVADGEWGGGCVICWYVTL